MAKNTLDLSQVATVTRLFSLLSDPTRLRLLNQLQLGEYSVNELAELLALKQANTSRQLGALFQAGLIERDKRGVEVYYSAKSKFVTKLCDLVCAELKKQAKEEMKKFR